MKYLTPLILLIALAVSGCKKEAPELLNAEELARAIGLIPSQVQISERYYTTRELFFFHRETSEGQSEWFRAFQTPKPGGSVKIVSDWKERKLSILVDDGDTQMASFVTLKFNELKIGGGWPSGTVEPNLILIRYSDSDVGLTASDPYFQSFVDSDVQKEADKAKWVRYSLVPGSLVPASAPAHIHNSIEQNIKQLMTEANQSE